MKTIKHMLLSPRDIEDAITQYMTKQGFDVLDVRTGNVEEDVESNMLHENIYALVEVKP